MKGCDSMRHFGFFVPIPEETVKHVESHIGGASHDVDSNELLAFVFGTAQEFWDKACQYDGDLQDVVEFFELKAEIARDIAGGMKYRFEPLDEDE